MVKTLTVLIGSMGTGKTTYRENLNEWFTYISQDEMGKDGHWQQFLSAVDQHHGHIMIDRINHLRSQRLKYVEVARKAGYKIIFKIFSEKYKTCLDRIVAREGHETIKSGDVETARKALDMYFNQFEYPRADEYDELERPDFIYGHSFLIDNPDKTVILGDLHGCHKEALNILWKELSTGKEIIISAGDLNDRGPNSDLCISLFTSHKNYYAVRGNHDDKLIRWLRGNKVNAESLDLTISQLDIESKEMKDYLYYKMMDMPYIIKVGKDNYITHAGFHPDYDPMTNSKEFSMYARYYDPAIKTFTNDKNCKYWFDYKKCTNKFYFGHIIFDEMPKIENVYALDGGCYRGGVLRAAVLVNNEFSHIVETPSLQPKLTGKDPSQEWDHMNKFEPYDKLVDMGYLNKKESGDLVLYNYTEKCTFEKYWNKYTMECRGLILNKVTGDTVARPFPKFFNLSELENKELGTIPVGESYSCYDKADGSLGILYQDPADQSYKIATRGSFESDQAKIATEMFKEKFETKFIEFCNHLQLTPEYTLCFEIIYPENRFNDGARLVCDYGDTKTLILLAAINKVTGKSLPYEDLVAMGKMVGFPVVQRFDFTIEQLVEMKKTLPVTQEGWVIQFESGFRVKIKGDEYCKLQKILNSISPLSIWEKMQDHPEFKLTQEYLQIIPEEIRPEVEEIEMKLTTNYSLIHSRVDKLLERFMDYNPEPTIKNLALLVQSGGMGDLPGGMFFSRFNGQNDRLHQQIIKHIRPKANEL